MYVYKVIVAYANERGKMRSVATASKRYKLYYALDKWTKAKTGYLFAFKTIKAAKSFIAGLSVGSEAVGNVTIFKCEFKDKLRKTPKRIPAYEVDIEQFWKSPYAQNEIAPYFTLYTPKDTVLYKELKPVKVVKSFTASELRLQWISDQ